MSREKTCGDCKYLHTVYPRNSLIPVLLCNYELPSWVDVVIGQLTKWAPSHAKDEAPNIIGGSDPKLAETCKCFAQKVKS